MKKLKIQPNSELKCIEKDILFNYEFKETSGENSIKKRETQPNEINNKMAEYYIIYKGLLTDMDIVAMAQTQNDAQKDAIISTCKEIQLNQLIGH